MKTSTQLRIERLDWLKSRLRVDEPIVLAEIASELNVSLSTVNRDIRLLREQGFPIEAERGRGGGTRAASSWGEGKISLTFQEAVDMLVSMAALEQMEQPMLFGDARKIRTKVVASFSKANQKRVKHLSARIKVGPASSPQVIASYKPVKSNITQRVHQAFLLLNTLEIQYRREDGTLSKRTVEPHFMVLNYPVWYLLCWDHLRNATRTFRCDRIQRATPLAQSFRLQKWDTFKSSIEGNPVISL